MGHSQKSYFASLRSRLLFLICLATFPAFLFTFIMAERERSSALVRAELDALHLARLAGREHAHQIQGASNLLRWLGSKLEQDGRKSPIITDPNFLRILLAGHPQLANVGILSPDGQVWISAHPQLSSRNWKDNPAFMAALNSRDIAIGEYLISPIFNRPTLNHAYAIRDAKGKVWAVLFNGLDLEWLSEIVRQADLPGMSSLLITDKNGQILAHNNSNRSEKGANLVGLKIPNIDEISRSKRGKSLKIEGTADRRYFVAIPFEGTPNLYVAVSLPYASILAQTAAVFYRTLAILGTLTLFTIIVVFLAAELGILRALRSLAYAVKRFGAGDLSARALFFHGHNEIASLGSAFNTMADSLVARHNEAVQVQAQLRALASKLQTSREEEAARISRELHDEIGQALTSLKIDISHLRSHCPKDNATTACSIAMNESIDAMNTQISNMISLVQHISSELRPSALDKLGLVPALEWLASNLEERSELAIQIDAEEIPSDINERVSITLFRIAQEALTNVIRHAQASNVEIKLVMNGENITLTVQDNGKGIMPDSLKNPQSLGIIGMRERAALIGGHLSIYEAKNQGTTVQVTAQLLQKSEVTHANSVGR